MYDVLKMHKIIDIITNICGKEFLLNKFQQ